MWNFPICGISQYVIFSSNIRGKFELLDLQGDPKEVGEHQQLGFITLNDNLAINLKTTHPPLLNGRGQFTFLKTKLSHSSGIVVYAPKFEFLRN